MNKPDFAKTNILCVGDLILDTFVTGTIDRISPEAPVPVFLETDRKFMLGGAGNVAVNLAELGCNVTLVGVVGSDKDASRITSMIQKYQNITAYIFTDRTRDTTSKCRYVAAGQHIMRRDREHSHEITGAVEQQVVDVIKTTGIDHDVIVVSDYHKGMLSNNVVKAIQELPESLLRAANVKNRVEIFSNFDIVTMNAKEFERVANSDVTKLQDIGIKNTIITRGGQGMTAHLVTELLDIPAENINPVDVSGAGDTVIATLVGCIAGGLDFPDAVRTANRAGGIVVSKPGTSTITAIELRLDISEMTAVELAGYAHSHGLKLGFVNGCFDMPHDGHVELLAEARKHCDILIVAINADEYIKRTKGNNRPIFNQEQRKRIIENFKSVSGVCVFTDDDPSRIIHTLQPHVVIKGKEYDVEEPLAESTAIAAVGAKIVFIKTNNSKRTTDFVKAITDDKVG